MGHCTGLLAALVAGTAAGGWFGHLGERTDEEDVVDITPVEVETCQENWGQRIVELGESLRQGPSNDAKELAETFVTDFYGPDLDDVIVKPPGVTAKVYRNSLAGLVAWLVGNDAEFPQDQGFARKHWKKVRFRNFQISITGKEALAMGHYYFDETKMEFSMGFFRDQNDARRIYINVQFFSLPFQNGTESRRVQGITADDVRLAQQKFVDQIVSIEMYHTRRKVWAFVDEVFDVHEVLFKPPDATEKPFRTTRAGIYSYFYGDSREFPEDTGFVKEFWEHGKFSNSGIIVEGQYAWAMGNYAFWKRTGERHEAQYTIGYALDHVGRLRISLFVASFQEEPEEVYNYGADRGNCRLGNGVSHKAIDKVQKEWANEIINIGSSYAQKNVYSDYRKRAEEFVDRFYAYQVRPMLFKPAEAGGATPFRGSRAGAISYFIGGNSDYQDRGFALQGFDHVHLTNRYIVSAGDEAFAVGHISYAGSQGVWRTSNYLMGFFRDEEKKLRINLQHGAFPEAEDSAIAPSKGSAESFRPTTRHGRQRHRSSQIELEDIEAMLHQWGKRIESIGLRKNFTQARIGAQKMADNLYAFSEGRVLLSAPESTLATRFRNNRHGLVSWLIGRDCWYRKDPGFAMEPWKTVNSTIEGKPIIAGDRAQVMGKHIFCCRDRKTFELDFAIGCLRDVDGKLRIFLHGLTLPYHESSTWDKTLSMARGVARSMSVSLGGTFEGGGTGALVVLAIVPVLAMAFVYFACCWTGGIYGSILGPLSRRPAFTQYEDRSHEYEGQLGFGYSSGFDGPPEYGYAQNLGTSLQSGDRFQSGQRRPATRGGGFASTAALGYQDQVDPYGVQSAYQPRAVPSHRGLVPSSHASVSPYLPGSQQNLQQAQSRRSLVPSTAMRGTYQGGYASSAMPQRMY